MEMMISKISGHQRMRAITMKNLMVARINMLVVVMVRIMMAKEMVKVMMVQMMMVMVVKKNLMKMVTRLMTP
jgi:hypothetical protein